MAMDLALWNTFEEELAHLILEEDTDFETAIAYMCKTHLEDSAELLLLAAICVVTDIDRSLGLGQSGALLKSHRRYRVIAALAADVALLNTNQKSCADLIRFWQVSESSIFLTEGWGGSAM